MTAGADKSTHVAPIIWTIERVQGHYKYPPTWLAESSPGAGNRWSKGRYELVAG